MENHLEVFDCHKDVFSRISPTQSTKNVSEALNKQLTLHSQEEWESYPTWNNVSGAIKRRRVE